MKKLLSIVLCVAIISTIASFSVLSSNAAMADEAEDYDFGVEYEGAEAHNTSHYFRFTLEEKMHMSISCKYNSTWQRWNVYSSSGKEVWKDSDIKRDQSYNNTTGYYLTSHSKNLPKGTYYLEFKCATSSTVKYSFTLDAEKIINLSKGKLSSLQSKKKGQFTAKCKAVDNAIGYQFQYSTNEQFKKKLKTVKAPTVKKSVGKLSGGTRYYVRVRPYTIYTDGTYVYGQYSLPKSVKVKKK